MTANDVVEIIQLFNQHQIDVYLDDGWGLMLCSANKPGLTPIWISRSSTRMWLGYELCWKGLEIPPEYAAFEMLVS
ncbi:MAG: hypothetical protein DPW09_31135 [Anaerolineae bacterium]|nr:hypothetical protein [Anaerolineales bacterium]MCQ3977904.1 hypothetical protein [Anaerolineae bacterium]